MPFLLLLLMMLACMPMPWRRGWPEGDKQASAALTGLAMVAVVAAALLIARRTRRALYRSPGDREGILQRYGSWRVMHLFGLFLIYGLALVLLGWGWTVQNVFTSDGPKKMFLGAELIILAPFLGALVLSWACFYDVERALHETAGVLGGLQPTWSRWTYVGFHVRQNLALILPPLLLLVATQWLVRRFPDLQDDPRFQTASYGVLFLILVGMPWILRLVLGLKPLPEGPLRTQLLQAAERLDFRFSNILLWPTRNGVANAMVVGVLPQLRYVVMTDRLMNELTPQEVEAVFGHEVGHVKHHHMLYYLGFLLMSLVVVASCWTAVFGNAYKILKQSDGWYCKFDDGSEYGPYPNENDARSHGTQSGADAGKSLAAGESVETMLPLVPCVGVYVFVVFGFLSRRCERQADIYGCRSVSCSEANCAGHQEGMVPSPAGTGLCATGIQTFIQALEKVARLNGISRNKPGWLNSWQHSTIARRVEFLQRMLADPSLEPQFQRRVMLVKWSLLLGLSAILLMLYF